MNKPLISIIMPVYNAEKHLNKSVDSILKQSYSNLELILVNDGSSDDSLNIMKSYSEIDKRVKVINKQNQGVSIARNVGIEYASGDYIGFIDADDYIELDMYNTMFEYISKYEADISICNYIKEQAKESIEVKLPWKDTTILSSEDIDSKLIAYSIATNKFDDVNKPIMGMVWRILIKSKLAKKLNFDPKVKIAEDLLFCIEAFKKANKIVVVEKCLYHYIRYEDTTLEKYRDGMISESISFHNKFMELLNYNNILIKSDNKNRYISSRLTMYTNCISNCFRYNSPNKIDRINELREINRVFNDDSYMNNIDFTYVSLGRKVTYILLKFRAIKIIYYIYYLKEKLRHKKLK